MKKTKEVQAKYQGMEGSDFQAIQTGIEESRGRKEINEGIIKVMKIIEIHVIIQKIMKIIETHLRKNEMMKIIEINFGNYENH